MENMLNNCVKLSVIVPVYNTEKYLNKCIDSLLNQTIEIYEIIIVNDGSTDNSGLICDSYANKFDNIKVIHQSNQGLAAARNAGIDFANGEWIAFVDSDDYVDNKMYEIMLINAFAYDADISICGIWLEDENGKKWLSYKSNIKTVLSKSEALVELNSFRFFNMSACTKIYKKSLFMDTRFPVGKKCEDQYIMHEILAKTNNIAYDSRPLYHYIQRFNSISRNVNINLDGLLACKAQKDFFEKNYPGILYAAETSLVFTNLSVYNSFIRLRQEFPEGLLKQIKNDIKEASFGAFRNTRLPFIKKLQLLMFLMNRHLYNYIITKYKYK